MKGILMSNKKEFEEANAVMKKITEKHVHSQPLSAGFSGNGCDLKEGIEDVKNFDQAKGKIDSIKNNCHCED
jgi:hypothetical protein